jgi:hypothetical protein
MNPRLLSFVFVLCAAVVGPVANAATVTVDFPTSAATYVGPTTTGTLGVGGTAQEAQIGDGISQTFTGTGLSSVNEAIFNGITVIDRTTLGTTTSFDLLINGTRIGVLFGFDSLGQGDNIHFSGDDVFLPVAADASGNFTFSIVATTAVATSGTPGLPSSGQGSWDFLPVGTVQLTGIEAAVPEPSTWAMMILGFLGVGLVAYRRKASLRFA